MTAPFPALIVEVAFANNPQTPLASLTWTDISHFVQSVHTSTGRDHELQRPSAGGLSMRLTNLDARFNPFNTGSPYYGPFTDGSDSGVLGLVPMKRVRVRAIWSGTTYPIWHGFIQSWPMVWPSENTAFVDVTAADAFMVLNLLQMRSKQYPAQIVADTPALYWRLGDPPNSTTAADSSGNNRTGTVTAPAFGVGFGNAGALINDLSTSCLFYNGNYIYSSTITGRSTTSQSLEFWVQIPLTLDLLDGNFSVLASGSDANDLSAYIFHAGDNWDGHVGLNSGNANIPQVGSQRALNDGLWHHIVGTATFPSGAVNLYVDGVLDAIATTAAVNFVTSDHVAVAQAAYRTGYGQHTFALQDVAFYNTILSAVQVANHFALGRGFAPQTVDARIGAVLDLIGWPTADRTLEASTTQVQAPSKTQTLTTTAALTHIQDATDTDGGLFYAGPDGKQVFLSRFHPLITAASTTSNVILGEGHEPYELAGTQVGIDDQDIWNTVITQSLGGPQFFAEDATSEGRYGPRTLQRTTTLDADPSGPYYAANYLLSRYKAPSVRVGAITVHPLDDPANLYPQALGRVLLDRVTVTRTPPGGGTAFSADYLIEKISHVITKLDWVTTWALAPVDPTSYLILNDTNLGKLNTGALFY